MQILWDLVDPAELTLAARMLPEPQFTLSRWLPPVMRPSIDYRFVRRDRARRRIASYRAYDTPAVIRPRPGVAEVRGELPPISVLLPLGEEEAHRLNAARAAGQVAVESIFDDDARQAARAVAARIELARGQALSQGFVRIGDPNFPENGLAQQVDFGLPAQHNVVAPTLWSDPTADILGQIAAWVEVYRDTSDGESPAVMLGSTQVRSNMLQNEGVRQLTGTILGTPSAVSVDQMQAGLTARDLPRFEVYDTRVLDWHGNTRRVIEGDRVVMLPNPAAATDPNIVGVTQFGRTLEADEMVSRAVLDDVAAPGLVIMPMKSENPISYGTLGTAIALPTIINPELLFVARVL
jgi:Phage major capsid protein E